MWIECSKDTAKVVFFLESSGSTRYLYLHTNGALDLPLLLTGAPPPWAGQVWWPPDSQTGGPAPGSSGKSCVAQTGCPGLRTAACPGEPPRSGGRLMV